MYKQNNNCILEILYNKCINRAREARRKNYYKKCISGKKIQKMYFRAKTHKKYKNCIIQQARKKNQQRNYPERRVVSLLAVAVHWYNAGYTAIQSRTVGQEQYCKIRSAFINVTDGRTDGPTGRQTDRPTRQGVESRVRD